MKYTFNYIEQEYQKILELEYQFIDCRTAFSMANRGEDFPDKVVVNRVDVDYSLKRATRLSKIFFKLGIPATFFVRLHANEYNPFSFDNYIFIKEIVNNGHEIGYHSEIVDGSVIWNEDIELCLKRDIEVLSLIAGCKVTGVASHGGFTGLNNLDFWRGVKAKELGLAYEAYEPEIFEKGTYISDSEWTQWKNYKNGKLSVDDRRSPADLAATGESFIYLLVHSDTYFDRHIYEL